MQFSLEPATFEKLPGWRDEDPSSLFASMQRCLDHIRTVKPYRTGSLGITADSLAAIFAEAGASPPANAADARRFIEQHFQLALISPDGKSAGFVTAFYEPEVEVSAEPDRAWRYPFYRRPDDLVDLDASNRPADLNESYAFGRRTETGLTAYPDRRDIDRGCLNGRGLEIAWARARVDVFFAHIQGAARLIYPDGTMRRITYAAKAGHPFTGIGSYLAEIGEIPLDQVSMATIRQWLADHPDRQDEILWRNRSYIFFRDAPVTDPALGPIAAAKVPLEAMRSLAVDRTIHTFSSLFYISSDSLTHLTGGQPFRRLMMAHDTGTAIVGPARGDIFTGSGPEAGALAGNVRNAADFFVLVPTVAAGELFSGR